MKSFDYQREQANAFRSARKSTAAFVAGYHNCGDILNGDEVSAKRSASIGLGCPFLVATPLLRTAQGEHYELNRCFATLEDASGYVDYMRGTFGLGYANVYRMNRGMDNAYGSLSVVALLDFVHTESSYHGGRWRDTQRFLKTGRIVEEE